MSFKNNTMPKGIPYIIGNEAAERYSFYGMKSILFIFLTVFIRNKMGELDTLGEATATLWVHVFIFGAYGLSIFGALISDIFLGKYKTIVYLSLIYIVLIINIFCSSKFLVLKKRLSGSLLLTYPCLSRACLTTKHR